MLQKKEREKNPKVSVKRLQKKKLGKRYIGKKRIVQGNGFFGDRGQRNPRQKIIKSHSEGPPETVSVPKRKGQLRGMHTSRARRKKELSDIGSVGRSKSFQNLVHKAEEAKTCEGK